jgi:hypothetical protein
MAFRETTTQGWGGRIMSSFTGAVLGVVLFFASFPLLWWNEGNAVATQKTLDAGAKNVVSASSDKVEDANNDKLIHITGEATTDETLTDTVFGVQAKKALRLIRKAEMYQYKEESQTRTEKQLGGGEKTITEYTYPQQWSEEFQDSSTFHDPEYKGKNPSQMPYKSDRWEAQKATVGAFDLTKSLVDKIQGGKELPIGSPSEVKAPAGYKVEHGGLYKGDDPAAPAIGDMRITFQVVQPATVSIVDKQVGKSLQPYQVEGGNPVELLDMGEKDADSMFKEATAANNTFLWIMRVVGFALMAIGIFLVMRPLSVLGDVVPFIGNMVGALLAVVAGLIALALSLITISIAWLFYRPLIGVPLLVAGIAGIVLVIYLARRARKRVPVEKPA